MLYNAIFGEIWKNVYTQDMKSMTQNKNTLKSNLVSQWDRGYLEEYKVYLQEQEQLFVSLVLWRRHFGVVFTKQKLKSDSSSGVLVSTLSHDSWPKSHSFFPRLREIGIGTVVPNNSEETEP